MRKIRVYDETAIKTFKKKKNIKLKEIVHELTQKMFRRCVHSLLRRTDARGITDIIYVYSLRRFVCHSRVTS